MCGIVGILGRKAQPVSGDMLRRMTHSLAHRGPDGSGTYTDGNLGLGHTRLSIIDLSELGAQPMHSRDGRYTVTYNGEIYNYIELRDDLAALGHTFVSKTDTEVALAAYAAWGPDCLARFNGMFALAIWDSRDRTLFLARDRYGIKPLYYVFTEGEFLFSSENKAILASGLIRARVDQKAVAEYFTFQNILTDRTLIRGINLFPAGCFALLREDDRELKPQRYWEFNFSDPDSRLTREDCTSEIKRLLGQAVSRQLRSDVPVGAYLSGGMDSGSITSLAARVLPYIMTFTCGFDLHSVSGMELGFDEREMAEHLSYLFKTEHYEIVLKAGDMQRCLGALAWHLEEPRVGQSYPNIYVAKLASKFVKVVMSGTGGDELFGGYPWRYYAPTEACDFRQYCESYFDYWQRLIPNGRAAKALAPMAGEIGDYSTRDVFASVFSGLPKGMLQPRDGINYSLYFEAKTFLHGLLMVEDKLSMAHGLETRVPFLDNDLVDFAMRVPVEYKLRRIRPSSRLNENEPGPKSDAYFRLHQDGKIILREAMRRIVPEKTLTAPKKGFSAPDATWFKGESIDFVRRIVFNDNARVYDFLDRNTIRALVEEHISGAANRRLLIWSLLNFETWLHHYVP